MSADVLVINNLGPLQQVSMYPVYGLIPRVSTNGTNLVLYHRLLENRFSSHRAGNGSSVEGRRSEGGFLRFPDQTAVFRKSNIGGEKIHAFVSLLAQG